MEAADAGIAVTANHPAAATIPTKRYLIFMAADGTRGRLSDSYRGADARPTASRTDKTPGSRIGAARLGCEPGLMTAPSTPTTISRSTLESVLDGTVIGPDDSGYDNARAVFSGAIDRRPALIARVANATDVAHVVSFARDGGLELAVRSGGHSGAGHGVTEGGIVLDLSGMRALEIDVERRTAWAETGLTAGEYTDAAGAPGLATGFGDAGSVGIGGITLGGGAGFLVRKHGLTIDDLLAAELVTADGELVRADAETNPDLFWAIRGGGGNFGVATRFQFRLHE